MNKIQMKRCITQIISLLLVLTLSIFSMSGILMGVLILTVLGGAFYCGWLCPFGTIQDIFCKLGNFLKIKKRKMPTHINKILKFSRYVLFLVVSFLTYDFIFTLLAYDPRTNFDSILWGNSVLIGGIVVIVLFGIISIFFERLFCNYLCPQGAKYGIFSLLRPITIKRNLEKCINCKKCDKVCPMNIVVSKVNNMRDPQCINCFKCISTCSVNETLTYGKITFKKNRKEK